MGGEEPSASSLGAIPQAAARSIKGALETWPLTYSGIGTMRHNAYVLAWCR
jgi:hypothetical protein